MRSIAEKPATPLPDWHPPYWKQQKHGEAWSRARAALERDWAQTKADFTGSKDLNQTAVDTIRQGLGNDVIPPLTQANSPAASDPAWLKAEPAIRYGLGAFEQYGATYEQWNSALEEKLASEWEDMKTGQPFRDVRNHVQHGWHTQSKKAQLHSQAKEQ
jgi:hypothetical protein